MSDTRDAEPLNPKKEWKQKLPGICTSVEHRACIDLCYLWRYCFFLYNYAAYIMRLRTTLKLCFKTITEQQIIQCQYSNK